MSRVTRSGTRFTCPRGFVYAVAVVVAIALFNALVGRAYVVPSGSMEPTFHGCQDCTNDRIAAQKLSYYFSDPKPGDVIVFAGPPSWNVGFESRRSRNVLVRGTQNLLSAVGVVPNSENILTKRVIATEGQTVSCQEGDPGVMVDGVKIADQYVLTPAETSAQFPGGSNACGGAFFGPVTVPEDSVWVMGDNRTDSADSRAHLGDKRQGTVPLENIRGKVAVVFYPLDRIHLVDHAHP